MSEKTAIVTGAAGSLGGEVSALLVESGWNVIMMDSDRARLVQVYDHIGEDGPGTPVLHPLDLAVAGTEQFDELLEGVSSQFGRLDALVHCAARFESLTPSENIQPEEWLRTMQVNLNAPWLLSALALDDLRASDGGKLVFVLDDLEKVRNAYWGPYGVTKHGLRALVSQLAMENANSRVVVKGVIPGPMRSQIRSRVYHSENPSEMPSPRPVAERIVALLEGNEVWDDEVLDLRPS